MYDFEFGSKTAKGGFANEEAVCRKFNRWRQDKDAQLWLRIMGYDNKKIDYVKAIQIPVRIKRTDINKYGFSQAEYENIIRFKKADVQIQIRVVIVIGDALKVENLSLKKANKDANYNQIDKRRVDTYKKMWNFDNKIAISLKLFTGESLPKSYAHLLKVKIANLRYRKLARSKKQPRVFLNELKDNITNKIIQFFKKNKILVVSDILKGRGGLSADWMLVTKYTRSENSTTWILKDINTAMNFFGADDVRMSPKGSLYIGRITMQRKGGTPDPTKLQFKIKPCELFTLGA